MGPEALGGTPLDFLEALTWEGGLHLCRAPLPSPLPVGNRLPPGKLFACSTSQIVHGHVGPKGAGAGLTPSLRTACRRVAEPRRGSAGTPGGSTETFLAFYPSSW